VWWVSWRVGEITVSSKTDDGRHDTRIAVDTPADWRYFLRIFTMSDGSVLLRGANADGTELHRITSPGVLVPVPDLPAQLAALPPYQVLPQADGTVLGLVDQGVVLWTSGGTLQTVSAPAGMVVRDATCDMGGRLWICGSVPAARRGYLATRGAWAVTDDGGQTWQVWSRLAGSLRNAWRAVLSGAAEEFRWIRVLDGYLVLIGLGGSPEDSSTLVMVRDRRQRWHSVTWPHDVFRAVAIRDGHLSVFSHRGRRVTTTNSGRLSHYDVVPIIQETCGMDSVSRLRMEVIDVEPNGPLSVVVAGFYAPDAVGYSRDGESVLALGAETASLVASQGCDEPEVVTAVSQ